MKPIRVVVLDDSAICRQRLREILEAEGDIEVVAEAENGDRILEIVRATKPHLLLVDLQMPGTGGHQTIELVMANQPLPILVVTALPEGVRRAAVFESVRRGALHLAEKPMAGDRALEMRLRAMVRELRNVFVVRHVGGNLKKPPAVAPAPNQPSGQAPGTLAVGIAASAGGPLAVASVLADLPRDFPAAIAIVQHLPTGFAQAFVEFLQSRVAFPIRLVSNRLLIEPGTIYVAPDDRHLVAADRHFAPSNDPPVGGHRPAADMLLSSLADALGTRAAGVVMSGIGKDGTSGLRALRARGALTLVQDEGSSAVYGMPRAALESEAALLALDPPGIARALRDWASTHGSRKK
ncbi:MAG: chemotaxis protein CheB [Myxococcota bacterium]